jgi:hypothetical protein
MKFLPGDIILTYQKNNFISNLMLGILRLFQKDKVKYQHAIICLDNEVCIEALHKITFNIIRDRLKIFSRYKVIRNKNLTEEERKSIANEARKLNGLGYGYMRLFLQLLDQIFNTNWFTKRIKDPDYQICSSLVAWCYAVITGIKFNGINWTAVEPDDIDDEAIKNPDDWDVILEWEHK